jgi:hypothetical protein
MNCLVAAVVASALLFAAGSGPSFKPESIRIGSRVKRGIDWKWVRFNRVLADLLPILFRQPVVCAGQPRRGSK